MISIRRTFLVSIVFVFLLSFSVLAQKKAPTLRPIQVEGKWGFIDKTGKIVIEPQFYWVEEFSEGLAAFEAEEGKHGYIDETGKIVVEPEFTRAEPFSEGLAPVAKNFQWGYIDKSGKIVIPLQYQYAHSFVKGIAPVDLFMTKENANENIFGITQFIDVTGKIVAGPFKSLFNPRTSEGLLLMQYVYPVGEHPPPMIMDTKGKTIVEAEKIDLDGFREEVMAVQKNKKWGYVGTTGKFVIEPQFADAKSFSEGLALVKIGKKWGFIDHQGKRVIPAKFEINELEVYSHSFSDGLALVYLNDRPVFIDQTGKTVFSPDYDGVERFYGGIAQIKIGEGRNEKRGYIDKTGKIVWGPAAFQYKDMQAIVEKSREKAEKEENDKLTALTDEEKKLNFRDIVADQPDFSADLTYFRSETVSGGGGAERITRKGSRYRRESQFWTFVGETGKSRVRLFPQTKTYDDRERADHETFSYSSPFNPKTLADDAGTIFTPLGKMTIDGHECIKLEVKRKGENLEKEKFFLYLAKDFKYLAIIAQAQNGRFSFAQKLNNISLEVADDLVQIPPDYKTVERDDRKK